MNIISYSPVRKYGPYVAVGAVIAVAGYYACKCLLQRHLIYAGPSNPKTVLPYNSISQSTPLSTRHVKPNDDEVVKQKKAIQSSLKLILDDKADSKQAIEILTELTIQISNITQSIQDHARSALEKAVSKLAVTQDEKMTKALVVFSTNFLNETPYLSSKISMHSYNLVLENLLPKILKTYCAQKSACLDRDILDNMGICLLNVYDRYSGTGDPVLDKVINALCLLVTRTASCSAMSKETLVKIAELLFARLADSDDTYCENTYGNVCLVLAKLIPVNLNLNLNTTNFKKEDLKVIPEIAKKRHSALSQENLLKVTELLFIILKETKVKDLSYPESSIRSSYYDTISSIAKKSSNPAITKYWQPAMDAYF